MTVTGFPEILPIDSRRYQTQLGRSRTSYDSSWHTDVTALVAWRRHR
jgi:alpha-ketoglutarate-dependent sulfate ester dioxygenase